MFCSECGEDTERLLKGRVLEEFCKKISIYCLLASTTTWEGSNNKKVDTPFRLTKAGMLIDNFSTEQSGGDRCHPTIKLFQLIPMEDQASVHGSISFM